ncbi:uncharacterized protein BP5553_05147 [Venustampulla echinocandica]|uniref:Nitrogen regulatory protein areA GATA-like domain-containing protein n=1 Tax=Venustampulla echinocandica TaxID=2656787 RepID=A0A370TQB2_9HELO|nr:uncharacterized protein BP5553_05147 [Venustampulla echinocandica]RDL37714.1 hypothetical protein BP5553_05147 [Venustampulla echinocandica]
MSAFIFSGSEPKHFSSGETRKSLFKNLSPPARTHSIYPTVPMKSLPAKNNDTGNKMAPQRTSPLSAIPSPSFGDLDLDSFMNSFNTKSTIQTSFDIYTYDEAEEDQITFPSYDDDWFDAVVKDLELSNRQRADSGTDSSGSSFSTVSSPRSESPELASSISATSSRAGTPEPADDLWVQHKHKDDNAIRDEPARCTDYLSHEWAEADLWASWKHVRRNSEAYENGWRLENAAWRSWAKLTNSLKTVSPTIINWRKDADNTWLYGPFQRASEDAVGLLNPSPKPNHTPLVVRRPTNNPYLKPILKSPSQDAVRPPLKTNLRKRSTSEVMQERSLYTVSLFKQAAAGVQDKIERRRKKGRQIAPAKTTDSAKKQVKFAMAAEYIPTAITAEKKKPSAKKSQSIPKFPPPPTKAKKSSRRSKSTSDLKVSIPFPNLKKSKTSLNLRASTSQASPSETDSEKNIKEVGYWGSSILPISPIQEGNVGTLLTPTSPNTVRESPSCRALLSATLSRPDSMIVTKDHKPSPQSPQSPQTSPIGPIYNWKVSSISSGTLRYQEDEYDIMARTMFGPHSTSHADMAMARSLMGPY